MKSENWAGDVVHRAEIGRFALSAIPPAMSLRRSARTSPAMAMLSSRSCVIGERVCWMRSEN